MGDRGAAAETRRAAGGMRLEPPGPGQVAERGGRGEGLGAGERCRERGQGPAEDGQADIGTGDRRGACESPSQRPRGGAPGGGRAGGTGCPGGKREAAARGARGKPSETPRSQAEGPEGPGDRGRCGEAERRPETERSAGEERGGCGDQTGAHSGREEPGLGRGAARRGAGLGRGGPGGWAGARRAGGTEGRGPWAGLRRGRGAGLGMRKPGCGSARRAPRPVLRLCARRQAPRQRAQRPGRRGGLGVPWAPQPHSSERPGPQRLTRLGTGSPSENRVTVWGSFSRKRRTCAFCPQSGDTGTPGHSLSIPNEVSQSPSPSFIQSLFPPPGQPLREWGVEPHKGSGCSPAPATITRFVRRENRGSGGQSLPCKRTHLLSLGVSVPGELRRLPARPPLSKPRNQSKRRCLDRRRGLGMVHNSQNARQLITFFFFFKGSTHSILPKLKRKVGSKCGVPQGQEWGAAGAPLRAAGLRGPGPSERAAPAHMAARRR